MIQQDPGSDKNKNHSSGHCSFLFEPAAKYITYKYSEYTDYKCHNTNRFHSKYSYIMFTYLTSVERKGAWRIKIKDLRNLLGCHEDSYAEYRRFNLDVLKKVQKDITELTSCRYTYEPIRSGCLYYEIKFKLLSR